MFVLFQRDVIHRNNFQVRPSAWDLANWALFISISNRMEKLNFGITPYSACYNQVHAIQNHLVKIYEKQLNKSVHFSICKTFFVEIYMVGYLKSFHKDSDCHGGQSSYCLMCNTLQPRRAFLMVNCKGHYYFRVERETIILNRKKKLMLFLSYEDV